MTVEPEAIESDSPPPREAASPPAPASERPASERPAPAAGPPPVPEQADGAFFGALREAGLLEELTDGLQMVLFERIGAKNEEERRFDIIEMYYAANGDEAARATRIAADRYFAHDDTEPVNAHALVSRLAAVSPELGAVTLERIGSEDGPLVLRAGDHLSAVTDEDDDEDEDGLSSDAGSPSITVRGLVRAINVLLDRHEVRERLVELPSDGRREAYVALGLSAAMQLCQADHLEERDPEALMEFAGW